MVWEQRGNKRYYYTGHRIDGHVVKIYHGNGEAACRQEKDAVLLKLLEEQNQQRIQQEMDSLDELDRGVAEQAEIAELIARLAPGDRRAKRTRFGGLIGA